MPDKYILIGQVLKPQGLRGLVKVIPFTDDPHRYSDLQQVYIKKEKEYLPVRISDIRVNNGFVFCALAGALSRDEAENQRNMLLYVDRKHAVKLSEDMSFICDIIGCHVSDEQGEEIGAVSDILSTGANDVYVLKTSNGTLLVPALKHVIKNIDIEKKRILVDKERMFEVAVVED